MGRHVITAFTLLILSGILIFGAITGWNYLFAELPDSAITAEEPDPSCTPEQVDAGRRLRSTQVLVSVFNGGNQAGLAESTLEALTKRGFQVGEVGNAPSDAEVERVEIWSLDDNDAEARLVAGQFGNRTKIVFSDVDLGPGIDVIVGDAFNGLAKGAKTSIRVRQTQDICVPVKTAEPSADTADTNASAG